MSEIDYSLSVRRRALNLIWTAAGEYGFEPEFLAFTQNGQPDLYMNSIIGYVRKWYAGPELNELFSTVGNALLRETFDGVVWIGLENCAYEREVKGRTSPRLCRRIFPPADGTVPPAVDGAEQPRVRPPVRQMEHSPR